MRYPTRLDIRVSLDTYTSLRSMAADADMSLADLSRYCLMRGLSVVQREQTRRRTREAAFNQTRTSLAEKESAKRISEIVGEW